MLRKLRFVASLSLPAALLAGSLTPIGTVPARAQDAEPVTSRINTGQTAATADYRLGSGDKVRVTVFGQQDLTSVYQVDGSGNLSFPLIGLVHAGGLTGGELEHALVSKLKPDYLRDPHVSVEVLSYRPFYILGEVRLPGSYPFVSGMSVITAVALAGGFTPRARESSFYLTRTEKNGQKVQIDVGQDAPVQPGDVITVRERFF